ESQITASVGRGGVSASLTMFSGEVKVKIALETLQDAVRRFPVVLDPEDQHAPGGGAGVDEVERLGPI
ncbi:MAG: hypothetical protein OXH59_04485, partial [Rhodospirillaceae bacterium]|nr:hypothetical protein [Rhodospirillaceae bacterium]